MAYKIIEAELAQQDLSDIIDYIIFSLENPSAAATLLDEVEACYDSLEQFSLMFETCHDPHLMALSYRKARIKNYIMIYKVNESLKIISIMRFFHSRQDYEKLI